MRVRLIGLFLVLSLSLAAQSGDAGELKLQVIQGEGAVYAAGSRGGEVLRVQVTGQDGAPVRGVVVSFLMPASGPGGTFSNGLSADVVITGADGMALVRGVHWNKRPGALKMRVTAAKGQVRAAAAVSMELVGSGDSRASQTTAKAGRSRTKVVVLLVCAAAGSVAAGLAVSRRSPPGSSSSGDGLSIDRPTLTVGAP
jgi:hypothetical protein